jgi:hypothetical protein
MDAKKIMYCKILSKIFFFLLTFIISSLINADDTFDGEAIALKRFNINRGWENSAANLDMVLKQGDVVAHRSMKIQSVEQEQSGERTLIRVITPIDLKGTALLTHTHDAAADEQWLYLPVIKRTKRIALETKAGAFLSSQFNFEDLSPFQLQKYTYQRQPDEACGDTRCYVVDSIPVAATSTYQRIRNWIEHDNFRLVKADFFDRENRLYKTLTVEKYLLYRDKYWKPEIMRMKDHSLNAETMATWSDMHYDERVDLHTFDAASLQRTGF